MLTYANLASAFLLTIFVTNCLSTPNAAVLKNVTIQKCCAFDEHTIKNATCVPGEREGWIPKIYSPRKKKYLPTGTTPTNWHLKPSQRPDCRGGSATTFSTNPTIVFENGSLFVLEYDKLVRPDKYCIDYNTTLFCLEEVQQTRPLTRVKKCCGEGALYKDTKKSCITMKGSDYKIDLDENKTLVAGFPVCDGHMVIASKLHEAVLQENGSLLLQDQNIVLPAGEFCVEHVLENAVETEKTRTRVVCECEGEIPFHHFLINNSDSESELRELGDADSRSSNSPRIESSSRTSLIRTTNFSVGSDTGQSASVFTCHSYLPPTVTISSSNVPPDLRFTLYPIGLALSAVFLAATLAAGSLLPASHHVLHWRCQTNHVVCLLVGYTLLCITQIAGRSMSTIPCFIIAVAMHFLFLAAFFWLNTMCFNIWWTFRRTEDHACKKVNIDQKSLRHHSFGNGEHAMIYPIRSST